jgi:adenosylcobinamide kinase/adenosylcobinamide-phosphate guanylyltransferase
VKELILGGQKSGKSRAAENRAQMWLRTRGHEAILIATAVAGDVEMTRRIARHRADRQARVPGLQTIEESREIDAVIRSRAEPQRLVIVDCLTLWLTQLTMPPDAAPASPQALQFAIDALLASLVAARGPVVLISNEVGLGVTPVSREARQFIDELGVLHQRVAAACDRVTLMVAGCELALRSPAT